MKRNTDPHDGVRAPRFRRLRRLVRLAIRGLLLLTIAYFTVILIGLWPVNTGFRPTPGGIPIYVISSSIHSEVILPATSDVMDWREVFPAADFSDDVSELELVAVGWGNRDFFLNTPTWAEFNIGRALSALVLPGPCCIHVTWTRESWLADSARTVTISETEYRRLCDYVLETIRNSGGAMQRIDAPGFTPRSAFYEAQGRYHLFNTCNSWTARALRNAGVKVPWLAPLPKTVFLWFPDDADGK
jgi:uncharacterized protein (TIGR02117 family)